MSIEQRSVGGLRKSEDLRIDQLTKDTIAMLPPEKQEMFLEQLASNNLDVTKELMMRRVKSANGEHDLALGLENLRSLDSNKKVYTFNQSTELGSGDVKVNVKGGDINFLLPVLIVIGVVILGLALIFF